MLRLESVCSHPLVGDLRVKLQDDMTEKDVRVLEFVRLNASRYFRYAKTLTENILTT